MQAVCPKSAFLVLKADRHYLLTRGECHIIGPFVIMGTIWVHSEATAFLKADVKLNAYFFLCLLFHCSCTDLAFCVLPASSLAPAQTRSKSVVEATMRTNTARLLVLDPPGLQCPESGGRASGGSFEDLLYNYANECLLQLYQKGNDTNEPTIVSFQSLFCVH
ncbi:unnamed protein product [Dibothriocephalus latus]|uniref:Uncharacterized protein n=1 Tax=Dibothriocephalus latus TaxID=60516 RepID=A0A3P7QRV5_DIBLA|nr:unnamed protein product [Dibothriocephalus latus]